MVATELLPIRFSPENEETITSWVARLATAHGLDTQVFCKLILGRWLARQDLDLRVEAGTWELLEQATGYPPARLSTRHSVLGFSGIEFDHYVSFHSIPWIFFNRPVANHRWFSQICPVCVSEGTPYYRRAWRLALCCICPVHRCYLYDGCPGCRQRINIFKLRVHGRNSCKTCHTCGFDLSRATPLPAAPEDCQIAQVHFALLCGHRSELLDRLQTDAAGYFCVLHLLCHRLTQKRPRLRKWQQLAASAIGVNALPDYTSCHNDTNFFELFTDAPTRQLVLRVATALLADWPTTFLNTALPAKVATHQFIQARAKYPSWFHGLLKEHLPYKPRNLDRGF